MFILPDLPYDYSALEPFIDTETMHVHHDKHHATYVKNLNDALLELPEFLNMSPAQLLKNLDRVPETVRQKVKNNGGGVANHNLFWQIMAPNQSAEMRTPAGRLKNDLDKAFGSFDAFKDKFTTVALGHFGSGWAWLTVDKTQGVAGGLQIVDTSNQDSPLSLGKPAILALDVWEHAYYLKYKNMRADYIANWWNVVNWKEVSDLYDGLQ